ncbi:MAG: DnaD domain protein [Clostridia bacterium]|nr:DnaD domain protein [Clostridia bacterium]
MPQCVFSKSTAAMDITPVENLFLLEFMPNAPENYVKVYLFGLMQCYSALSDSDDMAIALGFDETLITEAFAYWQAKGLVDIISTIPLMVEYKSVRALVAKNSTEEARRSGKYAQLVAQLSAEMGTRMLSGAELSKIYDWIELFDMDEEAVVLLVRHCIERKGIKVSIKYMDAVAQSWAQARVLSKEAAIEYLAQYEEITSGAQRILKRWRSMRMPTEDELDLYRTWTMEWGFSDETIGMACAEMTGAQKPSFKYLNSILETFRQNGVFSGDGVSEFLKQRDAVIELSRMVFSRAGIKKTPTQRERDQIEVWTGTWCMPVELVLFAADSVKDTMPTFTALKKQVTLWHDRGISTVASAREDLKNPQQTAVSTYGTKKVPMSMNYHQKRYTSKDLKDMGIEIFGDDEE